jgi:hypothetical protein
MVANTRSRPHGRRREAEPHSTCGPRQGPSRVSNVHNKKSVPGLPLFNSVASSGRSANTTPARSSRKHRSARASRGVAGEGAFSPRSGCQNSLRRDEPAGGGRNRRSFCRSASSCLDAEPSGFLVRQGQQEQVNQRLELTKGHDRLPNRIPVGKVSLPFA